MFGRTSEYHQKTEDIEIFYAEHGTAGAVRSAFRLVYGNEKEIHGVYERDCRPYDGKYTPSADPEEEKEQSAHYDSEYLTPAVERMEKAQSGLSFIRGT